MSPIKKGPVYAQDVAVSSFRKPGPASVGVLRDGDRVAFRVLESLPGKRYRILVRQQPISVQSQVPLDAGGRYIAEVQVRDGIIQFLSRPIPANILESLLDQGQILKTPIASLLRTLSANTPLPPALMTDCRTAEAVRNAFLNCGIFYEARVHEALRKRQVRPLSDDLKGFLLRRAGRHPVASVRETISAALKQVESHQLFCLQGGGAEGPFPFWLPFGKQGFIEGFVKRLRRHRESEFLLTLRVPFLSSEELLLTVAWSSRRVEVRFGTGPSAYKALRNAAHKLEEQLHEIGLPGTTVRVLRGVPKRLRDELEGIRFVESYA